MNEPLFWLKSLVKKWDLDFLRESCSRQNLKVLFVIFFLLMSLSYPLFASSKRAMDVTKDKDFFFVRGSINSKPLRFFKAFESKVLNVNGVVPMVSVSSNKAVALCTPLQVYAWVCGTITCANPKVILYVSVNAFNVSYLWTGPNGFVSTLKNPYVTVAGTYTVKVTSSYWISATTTVKVTQNIVAPGATASVSGSLSCTKTLVTLTGSSSTSGVTYKWTGPNNFVSTQQNPVVSVAGTYTLVVTNSANGCTSTTSVSVSQNNTKPDITVSGGALNCSVSRIILGATSSVSGLTYSWSGPSGFTSTLQNPTVMSQGNYKIGRAHV